MTRQINSIKLSEATVQALEARRAARRQLTAKQIAEQIMADRRKRQREAILNLFRFRR